MRRPLVHRVAAPGSVSRDDNIVARLALPRPCSSGPNGRSDDHERTRETYQTERARVLMLRVFDLAPKGPDKSAQGIALGDTQRLVEGDLTSRQP